VRIDKVENELEGGHDGGDRTRLDGVRNEAVYHQRRPTMMGFSFCSHELYYLFKLCRTNLYNRPGGSLPC
jgi:hypothetical protein